MKGLEKIECWHDTSRQWMYHVIGNRVTIITNVPERVMKFYKDDKKYNEMSADISVIEFEKILARTSEEVKQLEQLEKELSNDGLKRV